MLSLHRLLRFPFSASLWHLSLSLFSFLPPLFFCPLILSLRRADGGRLGCDPITDWLQQSPSADWFYNPRSRSQMGENQLVKKLCAAIKTHGGTLTHRGAWQHTHPRVGTHALNLGTDILSVRWDSKDLTTKGLRAFTQLKFCIWNIVYLCAYGRRHV